MKRRSEFLIIGLIALVALAAGIGWSVWRQQTPAGPATEIWHARFADTNGRVQAMDQWRGKVVVVNFWATWCPPCREEMPGFVRLQRELGGTGAQFVGIAIDSPDAVKPYAASLGVNYPVLIAEQNGAEWLKTLGNNLAVMPYTLIYNRKGEVASVQLGLLKEDALRKALIPLL